LNSPVVICAIGKRGRGKGRREKEEMERREEEEKGEGKGIDALIFRISKVFAHCCERVESCLLNSPVVICAIGKRGRGKGRREKEERERRKRKRKRRKERVRGSMC
jgi:hypothetical protein